MQENSNSSQNISFETKNILPIYKIVFRCAEAHELIVIIYTTSYSPTSDSVTEPVKYVFL